MLATEVKFEKSGEIVQVNMRRGSHDPLKFIVGTADINGIAMEGPLRMIRDAVNLGYEIHGSNPTPDELYEFVITQQDFLRRRLTDDQIKPDIEYHFGDRSDEVYDVLRKEFGGNIQKTFKVASLIPKMPIIRTTINEALKQTGHIPGSKTVQAKLVKALNGQLPGSLLQ